MTSLRPPPPGTPAPIPSRFSAPYWEGCAQGELLYLRCSRCGQAIADAPRVCWRCHSRNLRWEKSRGRGSLYSWTVVWRPQTPAFEVPYAPSIVHLDEGIFVMSSIIGCTPDELADGMEVVAEFHPVGDAIRLPYFRPTIESRPIPSDIP